MRYARRAWMPAVCGILIAIGCGSKPQEAAAVHEPEPASKPIQLAAATDGDSPGGGTVSGSVKFTGTAPAPERIKMDADPQCLLQHKEPVQKPDVVVNPNGTLQYVFVYVKEGAQGAFPPPSGPAMLDQQGCLYHPHVLGIRVNQPLEIVNNDTTLHNVNCKPTKSKPFNIAQPTKGMKSTKQFTAPEVMVKCACNVHPWMATYIGVVDNPFFGVTGEDGTFSLKGLPAGTYTIEAWHEKFGTQTQQVTLAAGESKSIDFEFKPQ